jgi:hypothetical protein
MTPPERDAAILEHLRRYHLTTPEILHRLFFPGVGLNAVRKVTSRLIRERRISPARLFEQRKYFVLTPREAERLGEHRSWQWSSNPGPPEPPMVEQSGSTWVTST